MLKSEGYVADCIVTECPYCQEEVVEVGGDVNDLTIPDIGETDTLECPHCHKEFIVTLYETDW